MKRRNPVAPGKTASDVKLIAEAQKLREQLSRTAARLEVYAIQLQNEVDRLHRLRGSGGGEGK